MYKFHYDFMKRLYSDGRLRLCYMNTKRFICRIKTEDCYVDITPHVEKWF